MLILLLFHASISILGCIRAAVIVHIQIHSTKRFVDHFDTTFLMFRLLTVCLRRQCLLVLALQYCLVLLRHCLLVLRAIVHLPMTDRCSALIRHTPDDLACRVSAILLRLLLLFIIIYFHN